MRQGISPNEIVTKFFTLDELKYYDKFSPEFGSMKFGTLESYRKTEDRMEGRFDPTDGLATREIEGAEFSLGPDEVFTVGNLIHLQNCGNVTIGRIEESVYANEWVFCAMNCDYSIENHRGILEPSAGGYAGNAGLIHYARLDMQEFMRQSRDAAARLFKTQAEVQCDGVRYEKATEVLPMVYGPQVIETFAPSHYDLVFTKSEIFTPEHEVRFVLRPDRRHSAPLGADPLYLKLAEPEKVILSTGAIQSNV